MGKGKIAVQAGHAAVSAAEIARRKFRRWWDGWLEEGQCKVAVKVRSERELLELEEEAHRLGLPSAVVRDRGLTQVKPDTVTCLGIGPGPADLVNKLTGRLRLL